MSNSDTTQLRKRQFINDTFTFSGLPDEILQFPEQM